MCTKNRKIEHRTNTNYKNMHAHTMLTQRNNLKNKNYKISGWLGCATIFSICRCSFQLSTHRTRMAPSINYQLYQASTDGIGMKMKIMKMNLLRYFHFPEADGNLWSNHTIYICKTSFRTGKSPLSFTLSFYVVRLRRSKWVSVKKHDKTNFNDVTKSSEFVRVQMV